MLRPLFLPHLIRNLAPLLATISIATKFRYLQDISLLLAAFQVGVEYKYIME